MVRGRSTPGKGPRRSLAEDDGAVNDFVGTALMVALVVAIGSVLAVLAFDALDEPTPVRASLALAPVAAGDAQARVLLRNGEPVPLGALKVLVQRGEADYVEVPRASWTTARPDQWLPGERLAFPLSPPLAADETLRVRLLRSDLNHLLSEVSGRATQTSTGASAPTLTPSLSPSPVTPDGVTTSLVTVRVSHPQGALAVASLVADASAAGRAAGAGALLVPLNDEGRDGDALGGDGVWSGLLRVPRGTPPDAYVLHVNATDAGGARASASLAFSVSGGTSGTVLAPGTTFAAPTSQNATSFRLRNWTWDRATPNRVADDVLLLRIVGDDGRAWSCLVTFDVAQGAPYARQLRVWGPAGEAVYAPRNGTRLPLEGLDMDLMDPVASLQWTHASGVAHPGGLYAAAGIQGRVTFLVTHMGQDTSSANTPLSTSTGLYSAEVVLR